MLAPDGTPRPGGFGAEVADQVSATRCSPSSPPAPRSCCRACTARGRRWSTSPAAGRRPRAPRAGQRLHHAGVVARVRPPLRRARRVRAADRRREALAHPRARAPRSARATSRGRDHRAAVADGGDERARDRRGAAARRRALPAARLDPLGEALGDTSVHLTIGMARVHPRRRRGAGCSRRRRRRRRRCARRCRSGIDLGDPAAAADVRRRDAGRRSWPPSRATRSRRLRPRLASRVGSRAHPARAGAAARDRGRAWRDSTRQPRPLARLGLRDPSSLRGDTVQPRRAAPTLTLPVRRRAALEHLLRRRADRGRVAARPRR